MKWHTWTPAGCLYEDWDSSAMSSFRTVLRFFMSSNVHLRYRYVTVWHILPAFSYFSITGNEGQIWVLNTCRLVLCIHASFVFCSIWHQGILCNHSLSSHSSCLQLPVIAKSLGKRSFKRHLELFLDAIFYGLVSVKLWERMSYISCCCWWHCALL